MLILLQLSNKSIAALIVLAKGDLKISALANSLQEQRCCRSSEEQRLCVEMKLKLRC